MVDDRTTPPASPQSAPPPSGSAGASAPRTWVSWLQDVFDDRSPAGRPFHAVIHALILVSVIATTLETLPSLEPWAHEFYLLEYAIVIVFSAELVLRVVCAKDRRAYLLSVNGMVDLLAVLPFWLTFGDTSLVRGLRLLRLARIAKLRHYTDAMDRIFEAFGKVRNELIVFIAVTGALIYGAAACIYFFEKEAQPHVFASIPHSLWWAVVTLTTVGYGDVVPVTLGGRLITGFLLLVSLGIVSVPSALLASALLEGRRAGKAPDAAGAGAPADVTDRAA